MAADGDRHCRQTLKHPNIVRLYDVIETDKYIGIILEYASGGELFDHILAHRYLREKDACKLFSQLISGVWYIHQKKIVHRDLKLENLLLDRHRNVIITDFGFANRFEHRSDDLMQTSCGSPCYAAPELVISDGLYVGSAVDIWSCGVILYAMLAGYLPFDDDPANPDGDNINLLYKYIVNTPLSFPDYISEDARDLLSIMLVPDPARRADLPTIMGHKWLAPYAHLFTKSVSELERAAIEQHHQKRLAYQRQMKAATQPSPEATKMNRTQSARVEGYSPPSSSSRGHRDPRYAQAAQPEFLYETSAPSSGRRGVNSAIVLPSSPLAMDDDPFAPSPSGEVPSISLPQVPSDVTNAVREDRMQVDSELTPKSSVPPPTAFAPVKTTSPESKRSRARHTIQVEYGESEFKADFGRERSETQTNGISYHPERATKKQSLDIDPKASSKPLPGTPSSATRERPASATPKSSTSPEGVTPAVTIEVTGPASIPTASPERQAQNGSTGSTGSGSSKSGRHRKGLSIDKIGISKVFGGGEQTNGAVSRSPSVSQKSVKDAVPSSLKDITKRPSSVQASSASHAESSVASSEGTLLSPGGTLNGKKSSRRNTLTVMVAPILKPRPKTKGMETPMKERPDTSIAGPAVPPKSEKGEMMPPSTPQALRAGQDETFKSATWSSQRVPIPGSTAKANKVMQWFRSKSKGRGPSDLSDVEVEKAAEEPPAPAPAPTQPRPTPSVTVPSRLNTAAAQLLTTPGSDKEKMQSPLPLTATPSDASFAPHSFTDRFMGRIGGARATLRVHHGAVDTTTITTGSPPEVMRHVRAVLEGMGIDISVESEYKYRCVRHKRKRAGLGLRDGPGSLAAFTIVGSAASNGVRHACVLRVEESWLRLCV